MRPVVVVVLDDQPPGMLGLDDGPVATTNIDSLVTTRGGVYFPRAYPTQHQCAPSRAGIWTSMHPWANGIDLNGDKLGTGKVAIAEALQAAGYETYACGKCHIRGAAQLGYGWTGSRWLEPDVVPGNWYNWKVKDRPSGGIITRTSYVVDGIFSDAANYVQQHGGENFFLWVAPPAPHAPHTLPPPPLLYDESDVAQPMSFSEDLSSKPAAWTQTYSHQEYLALGDDPWPALVARTRAIREVLGSIDRGMAVLMDALYIAGILDEALIVVLSDNGTVCNGAHQQDKKGAVAPEEVCRQPLIFSCPELFDEGRTDTRIFSFVDLAPTILDLVGVTPPSNWQGRSYANLLTNTQAAGRSTVCLAHTKADFDTTARPSRVIIGPRWKWINYYQVNASAAQAHELYDLESDPDEMNNRLSGLDPLPTALADQTLGPVMRDLLREGARWASGSTPTDKSACGSMTNPTKAYPAANSVRISFSTRLGTGTTPMPTRAEFLFWPSGGGGPLVFFDDAIVSSHVFTCSPVPSGAYEVECFYFNPMSGRGGYKLINVTVA